MRLLGVLFLQLTGSLGAIGVGLWGLTYPASLQKFLNENFALLPDARRASIVTSTLIRAAGIGIVLLGSMLMRNVMNELAAFGGFGVGGR